MALSNQSVKKTWQILNAINQRAKNSFLKEEDPEIPLVQDTIFGYGEKVDGGYENIYINIKNITAEQLATFERRKKEILNSSFIKDKGDGITAFGWF